MMFTTSSQVDVDTKEPSRSEVEWNTRDYDFYLIEEGEDESDQDHAGGAAMGVDVEAKEEGEVGGRRKRKAVWKSWRRLYDGEYKFLGNWDIESKVAWKWIHRWPGRINMDRLYQNRLLLAIERWLDAEGDEPEPEPRPKRKGKRKENEKK